MQHLKIYFLFSSAVFRCLSNDIALKGLFVHHCVVFSLFFVAIVISEPFFARAYFRPDFAAIRRKNFAARYFLACENIRFSSLFAAGDVSRGGTSATQRQKFHTDDVKSVRNLVRSAYWSTE